MKYSFLIAIENYLNGHRFPKVVFAENDLSEFKNAIKNIGYKSDDCLDLLNASATKTVIESKLRQLCSLVKKEEDEIIFYYAGHGLSKDGINYITCYDSIYEDLEATSIPMQKILDSLKSACKRVIFFFDSCHSGLTIDENMRGLLSDMNASELKLALKDNSYCIGFAACKSDESSYPITKFKHGAWTYHLIECLNGHVPEALEKGGLLTASSLQTYLNIAVPRSLRENYTDRSYKQTPWKFGGQATEILLGDLSDLLEKNSTPPPKVSDVELRSVECGSIRNLSGFQKRYHKIPDRISSATMSFVSKISQGELGEESSQIFDILRKEMGYKLKEVKQDTSDNGFSFETPNFIISVTIEQDEDDCSQYKKTIVMSSIDYDFIGTEKFNDAFANLFDTLVITLNKKIDLAEFVDKIENLDRDDINIDPKLDLSECSLEIDGIEGKLTIRGKEVSIKFNWNTSPQKMIGCFIGIGNHLNELGCNQLLLE